MEYKYFVEFYYPGILVSETSIKEISKDTNIDDIEVPKNAYGFKFFKKAYKTENGINLDSDRLNESRMYYVGGVVYSLEDVKKRYPSKEILIRNMENNNYENVIRCRTGNWQVFEDGDFVLGENTIKEQS